jgi:adenylate cyclase
VTAPARRGVLIVEDESIVANDLQQMLEGLGYRATAIASSSEEAVARAAEERPDIVLMDVRIRGRVDGVKTAQLLAARFGVPIVYLTGHADEATLERAKQTRPYGYVLKPVRPHALRGALEIALHEHDEDVRAREARAHASGPSHAARPRRVSPRLVRRALDEVLASEDFDASRRSKEFLRYIVAEALAGRGDSLTQSAIAVQVFGRRDDFDPVVDPIVRIQAGRLRRSLERYYLLSGKQDAVRIELPRGAYVPTFRGVVEEEAPSPVPRASAARAPEGDGWPWVMVGAFGPAGSGAADGDARAALDEELPAELARYRDARVLLQSETERVDAAERPRARFALAGRVRPDGDGWIVSARLVDQATGEQVWGDSYHTTPKAGRWCGPPEDVARVIAAAVGGEEGAIVHLLAGEHRQRRPSPVTPYGAILMSYDFFRTRDRDTLSAAIEALRQAVAADPGCGLAWTRLARLFVANHNFALTPVATPLDQAVTFAHRAVTIDGSRQARCVLALALLSQGELAAARAELAEALRLAPDSLVYLDVLGFLLTLVGDWERGPALSRTARERNPHFLPQALIGLWADHLRRGEIEAAYQVALEFHDPTLFWRPVMRASCLGHLGRGAEAEVAELLRARPDFRDQGRALIGNYIKFPDMAGRIVDGLAKAGLKLA